MNKLIPIFLLLVVAFPLGRVFADDRSDLQSQIDQKNRELEQINKELQSTQVNLQEVQKQKKLVQSQIGTLQNSLKTLDLSIKSDEIHLDRLGLEIEFLNGNLKGISDSLGTKHDAVINLFQELQRNQDENMITFLLRYKSLAEGIGEVQSVTSLKIQLVKDIQELKDLEEKQNNTLKEMGQKKSETETHKTNLKYRKLIAEDQKKETQTLLENTKTQESAFESKLNDLKKQQDSLQDEIQAIEDRLKKDFNFSVVPGKSNYFIWPVLDSIHRITQHFGEYSNLYKSKTHNGLDIGEPVGTPVVAVANGTVMAVDNNDVSSWRKYQYGKYVLIKHENGLATLYGHLSAQTVHSGQEVKQGMIIGYSGNTGYSTGPHLHLGTYWAQTIQLKVVNPAAGLVPIGVVLNPEDYF